MGPHQKTQSSEHWGSVFFASHRKRMALGFKVSGQGCSVSLEGQALHKEEVLNYGMAGGVWEGGSGLRV